MLLSIFVIIASFEELNVPTFQYLPNETFQTREDCETAVTNHLYETRTSHKVSAFGGMHTFRAFSTYEISHDNKDYYRAKLTCVEVTLQK